MGDPYALRPDAVEEPPPGFWAGLRRVGPGLVLAASIVGSGARSILLMT